MNLKQSVVLTACVLMSACSSTSTPNNSNNDSTNISTSDAFSEVNLYGYLEKDKKGNYSFSKFKRGGETPSRISEEPWVSLHDMQPQFVVSNIDCSTGGLLGSASKPNNKICDSEELKDQLFRSSTLSAGDVAQSTVLNAAYIVFSFGLGALSAEGHYTSEFDIDAYEKAVKDASSKIDLNKLRNELDKFLVDKQENEDSLNAAIDKKYLQLKNSLDIHFIDKSKLYKDTLDKQAIRLGQRHVDIELSTPWTVFSDMPELYQALNEQIKFKKELVTFTVNCDTNQFRQWSLSTSGCDKSVGLGHNQKLSVTYQVNNKKSDKIDYFPALKDRNISLVSKDNSEIVVVNNTNSFVKVDALSFYVGEDIETKNNLSINIPPQAKKHIGLMSDYRLTTKRLTMNNVVASDLKRSIKIGAAMKYVVVDTDKEKTLYDVKRVIPAKY
ncbi:hypothetical protein [Photobacterium sp.]|uniref:hypothetical protein n=1 Tax=Photobacterium sp. TaxID=660 RepID=UPI00299D8F69|nr:hypothetical protein [Photobacterium sp.]MDX1303437.1 hypothetical protein [Photobacterium sp.]